MRRRLGMPLRHAALRSAQLSIQEADPPPYLGSRFSEVWKAVASDPYQALPEKRIGLFDVLHYDTLKQIYQASVRTLNTREDLLPPFQKPVHPVGICLRGTWHISEPSSYTGYFRQGSRGLLIARASENMGETRPGRLRFLALAGKLYPSEDPNHGEPLRTANFVMNEDLVGSHTPHYLDATLTTDLLPLREQVSLRLKLPAGLLVAAAFACADRATNVTQALRRQLYPIAQLGEDAAQRTVAPRVMRLVPEREHPRVDNPDFRKELAEAVPTTGVRYAIEVSEQLTLLRSQRFQRLGTVQLADPVASYSGDHRLHFHHARFRHR